MSFANKKGSFFRTIEINRDSVAKSTTTLIEPILKQSENYLCQVQRFVTNITPAINTFATSLLSVLPKPAPDDVGTVDTLEEIQDEYGDSVENPQVFFPTNIHSVTELARQLNEFCKEVGGLTFVLNPDFTFTITMTSAFGNDYYIKLDKTFAELTGLDEYLFYFRARVPRDPDDPNAGLSQLVTNNNYLWLSVPDELSELEEQIENFHFRPGLNFLGNDPASHSFISGNTLFNIDTRQFLDVTFTMPHISQITVLNGKEERRKLLARFPLKDFLDTEHITQNDFDSYGVRETINLGLEDLAKNPDTHTMLLLPGEVQHANVLVETTYLENKKFITVPTDFGPHGFWSLKLILAKKTK